jgi:hypothetical protein
MPGRLNNRIHQRPRRQLGDLHDEPELVRLTTELRTDSDPPLAARE